MPTRKTEGWATFEDVVRWLNEDVFRVEETETGIQVFKGEMELSMRTQLRKRMNEGDDRVDLYHESKRRSLYVSQLVWVWHTREVIPTGWQIHHVDEDKQNNRFENLMCVHPLDHYKLHRDVEVAEDEVPF